MDDQQVTKNWSIGFRDNAGTVASGAGYPKGNNIKSFSSEGLFNNDLKAGPQFNGVLVSVTSPATCTAAKNKPAEIEHEISL